MDNCLLAGFLKLRQKGGSFSLRQPHGRLIHDGRQKIRDIYAPNLGNTTIAAKEKNASYRLAQGAVIE
jgi:hypothetical protein